MNLLRFTVLCLFVVIGVQLVVVDTTVSIGIYLLVVPFLILLDNMYTLVKEIKESIKK